MDYDQFIQRKRRAAISSGWVHSWNEVFSDEPIHSQKLQVGVKSGIRRNAGNAGGLG
jgi:hypothetical protein